MFWPMIKELLKLWNNWKLLLSNKEELLWHPHVIQTLKKKKITVFISQHYDHMNTAWSKRMCVQGTGIF